MKYKRFTPEFKRSLIEQLLSETATPTELCRRYTISSGQLYTWRRQYAGGKLDPEPFKEAELAARVRELERLVGKLTLENEFLKKPCRTASHPERKGGSLPGENICQENYALLQAPSVFVNRDNFTKICEGKGLPTT
jgi:transposase